MFHCFAGSIYHGDVVEIYQRVIHRYLSVTVPSLLKNMQRVMVIITIFAMTGCVLGILLEEKLYE